MDYGDLSAQPSEAMAAETWARTAKAQQVRGVRARGISPAPERGSQATQQP
jgi:hypothetical protein